MPNKVEVWDGTQWVVVGVAVVNELLTDDTVPEITLLDLRAVPLSYEDAALLLEELE